MLSASSVRNLCAVLITCVVALLARGQEVYLLKKLVIADTAATAASAPDDKGDQQIVIHGVPFLDTPEFTERARAYLGRPIDEKLLNELMAFVLEYARGHDRLIAKVEFPNGQNISAGTLRLAVIVGRYNQFIFKGNRFFTQKLLEQKLGIKPGDEVRQSVLESAVEWANANPFRQVKVLINELPNQPDKADLLVAVQDVRPFKLTAGYSNSGIPILGRNQYSAGIQLGNLWGLDHQGSYQFLTGDDIRVFQAHAVSYVAPLPWHHYLNFSASYVKVRPTIFEGLNQTGENASASVRYRIPLGVGDKTAEVFFGADFKESNNNLEYGGTDLSAAKINIFQGVLGLSVVRRDKSGAWVFGASANLSPGNINSKNSDASFQPGYRGETFHVGRLAARARYATATLSAQRWLKLPKEWDFYSRLTAQFATANLVSDEQLTIGGVNTVRGFNPNVFSGEEGYIINNDLQTPSWKHTVSFLPKNANTLDTRLGLFYDAAQVFYKKHFPVVNERGIQIGWDDSTLRPIAGAGVSVRTSIGTNLSLNFDYGWAVTHPKPPVDTHGQGHIRVSLAF